APARRAAPPQRASARDPEARRLAGRARARLSAAPPGPVAGGVMPMTSSPDAVASAILSERDGAVLVITLHRPERRTAVKRQMWGALREAFIGARADAGVHAVMVTGSGGSFCARQDLGEMTGEDDPGFGALMDVLCEFDKPLLAAVNGVGVGFGLTVLLHCDVVYIAEGARLRLPFVTLGVVPEAASSYLLPAIIGWQP